MSKLLYPSEAPAHAGVAFNLADLERQGEALLERAKGRAAEIIVEARREAERIAEQAKRAGFEGGKAEGLEVGREEGRKAGVEQGLGEARAATAAVAKTLASLVNELSARRETLVKQAERDLLKLSVAVAGRIVRRELALDGQAVGRAVAEAVALSAERSRIVLRVNPAEVEVLARVHEELSSRFAELQDVKLVGDEGIERGGCRLLTDAGEVDMRVATQLDRIGRLLEGEAEIETGGGEGGA